MFRFLSTKNPVKLKKAYLAEYNVKLLQKRLGELLEAYPEIKDVLPTGISAKKLLIGDFKYLTKVYCAFTNYLNGKTTAEKNSIKNAFKEKGFKYDSHKSKIT